MTTTLAERLPCDNVSRDATTQRPRARSAVAQGSMTTTTITTDAPDAPAPASRYGAISAVNARRLSLAHAVLTGATLAVSAMLAVWGRLVAEVDPARSLAMQRTHAVAALLALMPLGAALVSNGALDEGESTRSLLFRRARIAALSLHAASVALLIIAAHYGATSYGAAMATAFSAQHASGSVLWLLAAVSTAAASSALSSILSIVSLHRGPRSAWTSGDPALWAAYVASYVGALAAPVALLWAGFAAMERTVGVGVFEPSLGGHPLRFQLLRALWMQPVMVSWLILALGVLERSLWQRAGSPAERSRWPAVVLALLSPFGLSPIEHSSHESSLVIAQSSLLAVLFYLPFFTIARRWVALLARADRSDKTLVALVLGALAAMLVAVPAGVLMALANVGPALSLTPFAMGAQHALLVGVGASAAALSIVRASRSEREPAVVVASWGIAAGVLLAFVPPLVAGARAMTALRGALAWTSTMGASAVVIAMLVLLAFGARNKLTLRG